MREEVMHQLALILQDNMGNKITGALATGIATTMNKIMLELEEKKDNTTG